MSSPDHQSRQLPTVTSRFVVLLLSIILIVIGLMVVLGWIFHHDEFIQFSTGDIETEFNSGLCFILLGIANISIIYELNRTAQAMLISVLLIAILTLAEYVFNSNLGIDNLFFTPYKTFNNLHPGRMSSYLAFSFAFAAISTLILTIAHGNIYALRLSGALGVFMLAVSLLLIQDDIASGTNTLIWGNFLPKSTITFGGFLVISICIIWLNIHNTLSLSYKVLRYVPLYLVFLIFSITLLLAWRISLEELNQNQTSNLPIRTFYIGLCCTITISIILFLLQSSYYSSKLTKKTLAIMQAILDSAMEGIIVVKLNGSVVMYNAKFLQLWRINKNTMLNFNINSLIKMEASKSVNRHDYFVKYRQLSYAITEHHIDELLLKKNIVIERDVRPYMIENEIVGRVFGYRDITLRKNLEELQENQETYDSITGLPNRSLVLRLASVAIASASEKGMGLALLLIKANKLVNINDLFGRAIGDILLKDVANSLKNIVSKECILGYLGADEFIVIHPDIPNDEAITDYPNLLLQAFAEPFHLSGHDVKIGCNIGVALFPKDGIDTATLLASADIAMLHAKKGGENCVQFYSREMSRYTINNIALEGKLHKAIQEDQFIVYYQPIMDIIKDKIIGIEALVRWKTPDGQIISPMDFIPLAEETDLIIPIGEMVLNSACKQALIWHTLGYPELKIAINLSAQQFKYGAFIITLTQLLENIGMDPKNLELELTESVLFSSTEELVNTINKLSALGISISIDDFGTGYSSFNYINKYPINKIKIDRSFVMNANDNHKTQAIIKAMVAIAKSLNYVVVAEGVETKEQLDLMKKLGCDQAQGFYFARPMPAEECTRYLNSFKHQ